MSLVTVYGDGGFDPLRPNNNVVDQHDDGEPAPSVDGPVVVQVDPQALTNAQAAITAATTVAALRKAVGAALDLLNPAT